MAAITLLDAVTPQQVIVEAERNLLAFLPAALPAFRLIVSRCLRVVPDATVAEIEALAGQADPKDAPILAAAICAQCSWLVTFNLKHYQPGHPAVRPLRSDEFVSHVRGLLAALER